MVGDYKKLISSSKQDSNRHFLLKSTNNNGSYNVHDNVEGLDIEAF